MEEAAWVRYKYHEVVRGAYSAKGEIGKLDQLEKQPSDDPLWRSYFAFDGRIIDYLKQHGRIQKEYPHEVGINEIILDLDTKEGIAFESVLEEARRLVQYLIRYHEVPSDYLRVFFSGSKGFHIHMPNLFGYKESDVLPEHLKATLETEFSFCESLDLTMIRKNGLIRVPYSRHQTTGLYKQPLPWDMFFKATPDQIRAYSVQPVFMRWNLPDEIEPVLSHIRRVPEVKKKNLFHDNTDTTTRVTCMQKLYNRGAIEGRGHDDSLRIASWLRRTGIPRQAAFAMLADWYGGVDVEDQVKVVNSVYDKQYTYSCHDKIMREFCDSRCIFHKSTWEDDTKMPMVNDSRAMLESLKDYKDLIAQEGAMNLKDIWPSMSDDYVIYPGEVMMITGDTGMGKSALAQNIVVHQGSVNKRKVLYLNLEMHESMATRRFLQIAHRMTKFQVLRAVGTMSDTELMAPISHIAMVSIAPKTSEVLEQVRINQPKILVIDTSDAIEVEGSGNNELYQMKMIIEMMRKLAQQQNITVIAVHHINKSASKQGFIDLNSLEGTRKAVTKVDHVVALTGLRGRSDRRLRSLKARDDEPFDVKLHFEARTMTMGDSASHPDLFEKPQTN